MPTTSRSTRTPPSLSGHAGSLNFGKIAGEKTRFSANYGYKSPGFDMNDLGFQRRADERYMSHWFQMRDNVPGRFARAFIWNLNQYAGVELRRRSDLFSGGNVNMHWTWKNYWSNGFGVNLNAAPLRDRVTRGGPARARQPERLDAGTTSAATAGRFSRSATTATTAPTARARRATTSARTSPGGRPAPRRSRAASATTSTTTTRSG